MILTTITDILLEPQGLKTFPHPTHDASGKWGHASLDPPIPFTHYVMYTKHITFLYGFIGMIEKKNSFNVGTVSKTNHVTQEIQGLEFSLGPIGVKKFLTPGKGDFKQLLLFVKQKMYLNILSLIK